MKQAIRSLVRKALRDQSGQTLPFIALAMTSLLGVGGLVVDVGHAYVVRSQLQNSANAAALAAAGLVYTSTTQPVNTIVEAKKFGDTGPQGTGNPVPYVIGDPVVSTVCVNMLMHNGAQCVQGVSAPNAVKVVQTAKVPTFLMALFGVPKLTVSATAMASMRGASLPWNIAVIIDSTGSMASTDSNCSNLTQFQCALNGVQVLLQEINPCPSGASSCTEATANVKISLFTFPNVLTAVNGALPVVNGTAADSIKDEIACGGTPATWTNYAAQPIAAPYTLPVPGATLPVYSSGTGASTSAPSTYDVGLTYLRYKKVVGSTTTTWDATYQITPFLSDYQGSSDPSGLNPSSNLVKAVGYGTTPGCLTYTFGIWGKGNGSGFGNTYVASSIYAAQSALAAEATAYGGQNAIILLSDGGMNASYYGYDTNNTNAYGGSDSSNQYAYAQEFPSGAANSEVGPSTLNNTPSNSSYPVPAYYTPATSSDSTVAYSALGGNGKGSYPDWYDQCQQSIQAGQYASNHSTTVFAVAYGASTTSGCVNGWNIGITDTTLLSTVETGATVGYNLSTLSPCVEMENIASGLNNFYSDYQQNGTYTNCVDSGHIAAIQTGGLENIYKAIVPTFLTPLLLPSNAQ